MYKYEVQIVLENGSEMGSHPNQLDLDKHAVANILNRRDCLIWADGHDIYRNLAIISVARAQLSRPHIASLGRNIC
jgi:hypothetical protein